MKFSFSLKKVSIHKDEFGNTILFRPDNPKIVFFKLENGLPSEIFNRIKAGKDIKSIVKWVCDNYDVSEATAKKDVIALKDHLLKLQLISKRS